MSQFLNKIKKHYIGAQAEYLIRERENQGHYGPQWAKNKTLHNYTDSLILSCLTEQERQTFRQKAWQCKEFDTYVALDPVNRAQRLLEVINTNECPDNILEPLICDSWCYSEHDLDSRQIFAKIFAEFKNCTHFLKTKRRLPQLFTVYRAGSEDGICWTIDKSIAIRLQNRPPLFRLPKPEFLQREVSRDDVICYMYNTEEKDIIILPQSDKKGESHAE